MKLPLILIVLLALLPHQALANPVHDLQNSIGTDRIAHLAAAYMVQDIAYKVLKPKHKHDKVLITLGNLAIWTIKEKYIDSKADWKDAGASYTGIALNLIVKEF